ncbi:flavin reductase family protein [Octadecabacter sp. CECT 8868]|uniref:flavin reductase family protein n=1 Tax=Octadecabacter algicola TaxID=2909342 RepID=UPI001F2E6440|nr:flavin reductase family protein [Octadecabacter algicola]MCF2904267.1 flavin reductase family protein [Octadecabacter algicola]
MSLHDRSALRNAFGSFITGVTVVTARTDAGIPVGFTANSFTSVSLDPPLLLVCPSKSLSSYDTFASCSHFAVNVLEARQKNISEIFAGDHEERFAKVAHDTNALDLPLITDALAQFSCAAEQRVEAGDHLVLIGRVKAYAHADGTGLGYAGGQYFNLNDDPISA